MQVCLHCGKQSRPHDKFCMHCGQRLSEPTQSSAQAMSYVAASGKNGGWLRTQPVKAVSLTQEAARRPTSPAAPTPVVEPASAARHTAATGPFARLIQVSNGSDQDTSSEFALDGRNVTIGRAPACVVSVPDDQLASRLHAMLHYEADRYTITDLGSSNGTLVNGVKIRSATPLADGDRITVGQHVFVFTATPAPAAAATPSADQTAAPEPVSSAQEAPEALEALEALETPSADNSPPAVSAAGRALDGASLSLPEDAAAASIAVDAALASAAPALPAADAPLPAEAFFGLPASSDLTSQSPAPPTETSATLAAWTASATEHTSQLRMALADLAERVYSDLSALDTTLPSGYGASRSALDDLIQLAAQVAADPQHVNSLMALASRGQDVATVLKNQQAIISTLEMVRDHLDRLAQAEGW